MAKGMRLLGGMLRRSAKAMKGHPSKTSTEIDDMIAGKKPKKRKKRKGY